MTTTTYTGSQTAGAANISINEGDTTTFRDASTAGTATINTNEYGGYLDFLQYSSAASATIYHSGGSTSFFDSSSAGNAKFVVTGNGLSFGDKSTAENASIINSGGGEVFFYGESTAAYSNITNRSGGTTYFNGLTAGEARITNEIGGTTRFGTTAGSAIINNYNGNVYFDENSTAGNASFLNGVNGYAFFFGSTTGNASIVNKGTMEFVASTGDANITNDGFLGFYNGTMGAANIVNNSGGRIIFESGDSTAGSSTIINSGTIFFGASRSTPGNAILENNAGGLISLDGSGAPISAGSIAGAGTFRIGSNNFTVGTSNADTAVSGTIQGVTGQYSGGSLTKVGTGRLLLSGSNTYAAGTTISSGTLVLGSAQGAGTGAISFTAGSQTLGLDALALGAPGGTFGNVLHNFGVGDTLDLRGLAYSVGATATLSGGTLTVTSGGLTESFTLSGVSPSQQFHAISNGSTGTAVVLANFVVVPGATNGADTLNGNKAVDAPELIDGLAGNDKLYGYGGEDRLYGRAGTDLLDGGSGADFMAGGTDNDTYYIDNVGDIIREEASEGAADQVNASIAYVLTENVENLTLTGTANIDGAGNSLANRLIGNAGANILRGHDGDDTLTGNAGSDTLYGDAGVDLLLSGADNDILYGGAGADRLDGGIGTDVLYGGSGDDTYYVDELGDAITEIAGEGTDLVIASVSGYVLASHVENLNFVRTGTQVAMDATGNSLANRLQGNNASNVLRGEGGNDGLEGFDGNDRLEGGAGLDSYTGGLGADVFVLDAATGTSTDRITDFAVGLDKLSVQAAAYGLTGGTLAPERFSATGVATSAAGVGQFVYNAQSRTLSWDSDGAGGTGAVAVATFGTSVALSAADILVEGPTGNHPAQIGGTAAGTLKEDVTLTASGALSIADPDAGESAFRAATYEGAYGSLVLSAAGAWTYTLNNALAAVQGLGAGDPLTDTVTIASLDGTTQAISLAIVGTNDTATISGAVTGTLKEDVTLTATGNLTIVDPDPGESAFQATTYAGAYGSLALTSAGAWTYTLDNALAAVQQLGEGDPLTDTVTIASLDGTTQAISLAITGTNGVATISNNAYTVYYTLNYFGGGGHNSYVWGQFAITDEDAGESYVQTVVSSNYGYVQPYWTDEFYYELGSSDEVISLPKDATLLDEVVVTSADGTNLPLFITIVGGNDYGSGAFLGPRELKEDVTISISGTGTMSDPDTGEDLFQGQTYVGEYGSFTYTNEGAWTYILNNSDPRIQALNEGEQVFDYAYYWGIDGVSSGEIGFTITGTNDAPARNLIVGTDAANTLTGTSGADHIKGLGGDDLLKGVAGDDLLEGGAGNDRLDGGAGQDEMRGDAGNDTYYVDVTTDRVIEAAGAGTDLVIAYVTGYVLPDQVENLNFVRTGTQTAMDATGNEIANQLQGNNAANVLRGLGGNDGLQGYDGDDRLEGGVGDDGLDGGVGNDILIGGAGGDNLKGGAGADTFVFDRATGTSTDRVLDFVSGTDVLSVYGADYGLAAGALSSGRFSDTGVATSTAGTGQFVFNAQTDTLLWDADGTGSAGAIAVSTFATNVTLTASDLFIL